MRGMTSATIAWALATSVAAGAVTIGGLAWAQELNEPAEGVSRVLKLEDDAHSSRIKSRPPRSAIEIDGVQAGWVKGAPRTSTPKGAVQK